MEAITRNVRDIDDTDRRALEHFLGTQLRENQQIMIHVVSIDANAPTVTDVPETTQGQLPAWCRVYEGLSDEEVTDVEKIVLQRANLTRPN